MNRTFLMSSVLFMLAFVFSPIVLAEEKTVLNNSTDAPGVPLKRPSLTNDKQGDLTSTDLYCETMTLAFFEETLNSTPPKSNVHAEKIKNAEREMFEICKSMPIVSGKEKKLNELTKKDISQLTCLAMADGISTAYYSRSEDRLLYAELSQKRQFFMDACASNRKHFLADIKKYGPYHVLRKNYQAK